MLKVMVYAYATGTFSSRRIAKKLFEDVAYRVLAAENFPATAMAAQFETAQCKLDYAKRKWIAEPPNGRIKSVPGFRQFSMRGLDKANAEFKLVCMALNLRRMGAMQMA